jgi:peptidoglycan DL-endopeptidase CwlO
MHPMSGRKIPRLLVVVSCLVAAAWPTSIGVAFGAPGDTTTTVADTTTTATATSTTATSTTAATTTIADSARRLTGTAPGFVATPQPSLTPRPTTDVVARLALDALAAKDGLPATAAYSDLLSQLATDVAAHEATGSAADLLAAWKATTTARMTVVLTALGQVGKPYSYGSPGPNSFDCSGLVRYAYLAVGVTLPHQSESQIGLTTKVPATSARPGDIAWYYGHVALVLGAGHAIVHAQQTGVPLRVTDWSSTYAEWGSLLP